jgi:Fic family protein
MIYRTPPIEGALKRRLADLSRMRDELGQGIGRPSRWMGALRREVRATSIESSTSIEGFSVTPAEALELTGGREAADRGGESRQAVACYARAMDHVGAMVADPTFRWTDRVILDLHFDACHFQRDKDPGLWRTGPIGVTAADGSLEFRAPDADRVVELMGEAIEWLAGGDLDADAVVRAAMAHLHVVSVHPFRDGNGRVARIVQSLVLAREGLGSPEFFSIEDYLGAHTRDYYAALRATQGGSYRPDRDATGWVEFCVEAHTVQAKRRLVQIEAAAARWSRLESIVEQRGWPDRIAIALEQSLFGGTDRGSYEEEAGVSPATASADLRRLLDAGLLHRQGRGRGTAYTTGGRLREELKGEENRGARI